MNTKVLPEYDLVEMRTFGPARRTAAERLVLILTSLGMTAALVKLISFQATRSQFMQDTEMAPSQL